MVSSSLISILQESGYTILHASDGVHAVRTYKKEPEKISLVLLDMVMPRMGGKEVFAEIKKLNPDVKTIFVSGYSPDILLNKTGLEESIYVLRKPVSPSDLLLKIREVLDS